MPKQPSQSNRPTGRAMILLSKHV